MLPTQMAGTFPPVQRELNSILVETSNNINNSTPLLRRRRTKSTANRHPVGDATTLCIHSY